MAGSEIVILTTQFPFGKGESFFEEELRILAREFDFIYILPCSIGNESHQRSVPENCKVLPALHSVVTSYKSKALSQGRLNVRILLKDFIARPVWWKLRRIGSLRKLLSRAIDDANSMEDLIRREGLENAIFYNYWFDESALAIAVLKRQGVVKKWVARSHGYDLYDERHSWGHQPFRYFKSELLDKMFCISEFGKQYLKKGKFNATTPIEVAYLGVKIPDTTVQKRSEITFISCSNLIPLKRVHLIIEVLNQVGRDFKWIHFGEGSELETLKAMAQDLLPESSFEFRGQIPKEDIITSFLEANPAAFLHFSETEGAPVSIMEALACGIPVLACGVGGIPDMIPPSCGHLLPREFRISDAVALLQEMIKKEQEFDPSVIQRHARSNFSAKDNYYKFALAVKELFKLNLE